MESKLTSSIDVLATEDPAWTRPLSKETFSTAWNWPQYPFLWWRMARCLWKTL